jgi:hypothetical protein
MSEAIRRHFGLFCIALGVAALILGALLTPGGDQNASVPYQVAGVIVAAVIYFVGRRRVRRSD